MTPTFDEKTMDRRRFLFSLVGGGAVVALGGLGLAATPRRGGGAMAATPLASAAPQIVQLECFADEDGRDLGVWTCASWC